MARILIIDDDQQVRNQVRFVLQNEGHNVHEATDRADANLAFKQHSFDVLFCDLFMPQQEGLETISDMRREFPALKIVAMSGGSCYGDGMDYLLFAELLGASSILRKPFDRRNLLKAFGQAQHSPEEADMPRRKVSAFGNEIRDWR
jgi:CheY-like chemotaxis protein